MTVFELHWATAADQSGHYKEGGPVTVSGPDSSVGIKKLNDLDQMRGNKKISKEEYYPEMIPEPDEAESAESVSPEPD